MRPYLWSVNKCAKSRVLWLLLAILWRVKPRQLYAPHTSWFPPSQRHMTILALYSYPHDWQNRSEFAEESNSKQNLSCKWRESVQRSWLGSSALQTAAVIVSSRPSIRISNKRQFLKFYLMQVCVNRHRWALRAWLASQAFWNPQFAASALFRPHVRICIRIHIHHTAL